MSDPNDEDGREIEARMTPQQRQLLFRVQSIRKFMSIAMDDIRLCDLPEVLIGVFGSTIETLTQEERREAADLMAVAATKFVVTVAMYNSFEKKSQKTGLPFTTILLEKLNAIERPRRTDGPDQPRGRDGEGGQDPGGDPRRGD